MKFVKDFLYQEVVQETESKKLLIYCKKILPMTVTPPNYGWTPSNFHNPSAINCFVGSLFHHVGFDCG